VSDTEIELDELERRLGELTVVDVRRSTEYDGTFGSPCDPRQGHIPGAQHLELDELLLLTEAQVAERLGLEPGAEVVVYCHSGSRSAFAAQVLRQLGYRGRNYVGSWHEWSRTDHPLET
jgi:thiosulfate/3-mercaptopyruvate sulfurtransferase